MIYQIYPRSFCDSNGDGIGDLQGIIQKLDYIQKLGVDAIWLSPVYRSPQDDNGYDISDYQDIDPMFGTLADYGRADRRGGQTAYPDYHGSGAETILLLSNPWFVEAKKGKDNPYHDYYVWRDGKEGEYPNELKSAFCGPAWNGSRNADSIISISFQ